jgi:D-alanyl-D-alanine carboxypeptidase
VPEYNFDPRYITFLLQHPDHIFQPEEYLEFIDGKALDFEPGSKYSYRNSNYVILALIGDAVSGDHARLIADVVFKPLGLNQTFYRNTPNYVHHPNLVNSYWDRYGNGVLENASTLQRSNVASMAGDDGIITTPYEAVLFLKGLMEGKLISERTLAEMMTWVTNKENQPAYGLGLDYTTVNGYVAYGHGGAGLGAGCELFYFPEKGLYSFVTLNLGIVTESSLHARAEEAKNAIYDALLK